MFKRFRRQHDCATIEDNPTNPLTTNEENNEESQPIIGDEKPANLNANMENNNKQ